MLALDKTGDSTFGVPDGECNPILGDSGGVGPSIGEAGIEPISVLAIDDKLGDDGGTFELLGLSCRAFICLRPAITSQGFFTRGLNQLWIFQSFCLHKNLCVAADRYC